MKILWLSWKDIGHPLAGGAEVVGHNIRTRLAKAGHDVVHFADRYEGSEAESMIDGYRVVRRGSYDVYWQAYRYYRERAGDMPDIVIDEMNTVPFFARWYARTKSVLFVHQLAREVWFYQMRFPLSLIGYLIEPIYVRMISRYPAITVSQSSKDDLVRYGFDPERISIISEGIDIEPLKSLAEDPTKLSTLSEPLFLILGSIRPMKRTLHAVRAFEQIADKIPSARLIVAGSYAGHYGQRVLRAIARSRHLDKIEMRGKVSKDEKIDLMRRAHVLLVPSIKEGWGLVVTEAASQGTPTVVYNVDGLRDAVFHGQAGVLCATNTSNEMADAAVALVTDPSRYASIREAAWKKSLDITFDKSFADFTRALETV